jgi:chromosome segregation ATPase
LPLCKKSYWVKFRRRFDRLFISTQSFQFTIGNKADELLKLKNELVDSENRALALERQLHASHPNWAPRTSELAQKRKADAQHRDQIAALQRQIDNSEKRLRESSQVRNQLMVDLEQKTREQKFTDARLHESLQENHRLKALLEASVHGPSGAEKLSMQTKIHTQSLREELREAQDALRRKGDELDRVRGQLEEAVMRTKVLEKALEFRADEIGLTGHADLLAKVAGLRGEVSALKKDLLEKRNKLHDIESEKQKVLDNNLTLQQQLSRIQTRLAQSKQDIQRLADGEQLLEQLTLAEQERDVLLEFIQDDLQKNSSLTATADNATREAAAAKKAMELATQEARRLGDTVAEQKTTILQLESDARNLTAELMLARNSQARDESDVERYRGKADRAELASEELNKMHVEMLAQVLFAFLFL